MSDWTLAECKKVDAFDFMGKLVITAAGEKPTPCYVVKISPSPLTIFPPEFLVQWEQPPKLCIEVVTPYRVSSQPFPWPGNEKVVRVTHLRDGKVVTEDVPVKIVKTLAAKGGGGGVPGPFAVDRGAAASPTGSASDSATGYSPDFSFEEAFQNAIKALPARKPSHPDELVRIEVKKIGAELGGIAGLRLMFVEVERFVF
jgi:hypothetical protein